VTAQKRLVVAVLGLGLLGCYETTTQRVGGDALHVVYRTNVLTGEVCVLAPTKKVLVGSLLITGEEIALEVATDDTLVSIGCAQ
jgi:hypothetical protein